MKASVSKLFVIYIGSASLLLGLAVIIGWPFHAPLLNQISSSSVPMQLSTVLGFLLGGSALVLYVYKQSTYALTFMTIVGLCGLLTLIEHLFAIKLGIDAFLMQHSARMSPNTALCFLLFGSSAISYRLQEYRSTILAVLGLFILSLAITALVGYISSAATASGWGQMTRMTIHTSVGFCILGSGLCALSYIEKKDVGIPGWIPFASVIAMLTISVLLWQVVKTHNNLNINKLIKLEVLLQEKIVNRYIDERFNALGRMAERWVVSGGTVQDVWERDAKRYVKDQPIYQALEWVDSNYRVQWVIPLEGNEAAVGLDLKFEGKRLLALKQALQSRMLSVTQAVSFVQGGKGFLVFLPLFIGDEFDGFILGAFTFQKFFSSAFDLEDGSKDIFMTIYEGETELLAIGEQSEQGKQYTQSFDIHLSDIPWQVNIQPSEQFLAFHKSNFATVILLAGILIALLSGLILRTLIARNTGQQRLIEAESRSSAILRTVVDAVISINTKGRIIMFNPAAQRIFGYSEKEVLGENIKILMPSPYHEEHNGYLKNYLETGKKKIIGIGREAVGKRKDGSTFPMELAVSEIITEAGRSFTGVVRDITQHKNAMSEIQKRQDELERSNQELERFAYVASHDLQEPLRMVSSYTQLLAKKYKDKLDQDANDYIDYAVNGAVRMQALIQDLLKYSRLTTEVKVSTSVKTNQIFEYAVQNLAVIIDETGTVVTKDDLPIIDAYDGQLRQLFQNLIGNSVKYRDPEKLNKVHVSAVEIENGWQFCVEDNGIGISSEYFEKIFVIFKRLHTLSEYKGTGIGLSLCKRIVESHHGQIWVESEPGQGSRFYFTLLRSES